MRWENRASPSPRCACSPKAELPTAGVEDIRRRTRTAELLRKRTSSVARQLCQMRTVRARETLRQRRHRPGFQVGRFCRSYQPPRLLRSPLNGFFTHHGRTCAEPGPVRRRLGHADRFTSPTEEHGVSPPPRRCSGSTKPHSGRQAHRHLLTSPPFGHERPPQLRLFSAVRPPSGRPATYSTTSDESPAPGLIQSKCTL